jgi:hypothetical protein
MTLTDKEGYVIFAGLAAGLLVGYATGRAVLACLPMLAAGVFLAFVVASDDLYSRIPEDVQATVVYALGGSAATILTGAVIRRIIDAHRLRRRPGT